MARVDYLHLVLDINLDQKFRIQNLLYNGDQKSNWSTRVDFGDGTYLEAVYSDRPDRCKVYWTQKNKLTTIKDYYNCHKYDNDLDVIYMYDKSSLNNNLMHVKIHTRLNYIYLSDNSNLIAIRELTNNHSYNLVFGSIFKGCYNLRSICRYYNNNHGYYIPNEGYHFKKVNRTFKNLNYIDMGNYSIDKNRTIYDIPINLPNLLNYFPRQKKEKEEKKEDYSRLDELIAFFDAALDHDIDERDLPDVRDDIMNGD